MDKVLECHNLFFSTLGQRASVEKTKKNFSKGVPYFTVRTLSYKYGFGITHDLGKYLGVPFLHRRITKQTYGYIIESLHQKLVTWKSNRLSCTSRIILCKLVLATVPLYPMQSTLLPKLVCSEIENICCGFI